MVQKFFRALRGRAGHPAPVPPPPPETDWPDDELQVSPPLDCTPEEVERWNAEWFEYLKREWTHQLAPYTDYPDTPPLPDSPLEMLKLTFGFAWDLHLYCDKEALAGKRVMEMGCGCGNMGKLLGRYADTYLGTDYSTLALKIARLVSPPNCRYVHVADRAGLEPYFGTIDTIVGRHFWIHQNLKLGRWNLELMEKFLKPGGLLYADFFWPNPEVEQYVVFPPDHALSKTFPSAMFLYKPEDIERLIEGHPLRIVREEISPAMQRRYVVFERLPSP